MRNIILFLGCLVGLIGCGCDDKPDEKNLSDLQRSIKAFNEQTIYFRNPRSGVCYSSMSYGSFVDPSRVSVVQCSDEVIRLLVPLN